MRSEGKTPVLMHDTSTTFISDFFDYLRERSPGRPFPLSDSDGQTPLTVRLPSYIYDMLSDVAGHYDNDPGQGGEGKRKKGMGSANYAIAHILKTFFDVIYRAEAGRPELIRHRFAMICLSHNISPVRLIKLMNAMSCSTVFDMALFESMSDEALIEAIESSGAAKILSILTGLNEEWVAVDGAAGNPFEEQATIAPLNDMAQLGLFTHLTMTSKSSYFNLPVPEDFAEGDPAPKLEWSPSGVHVFESDDANLPLCMFLSGTFAYERSKMNALIPIGMAYAKRPESMKYLAMAVLRSKNVGIPVYQVETSATGIKRLLQGRHPILSKSTPYGVLAKNELPGRLVDFSTNTFYVQYKADYSKAIGSNAFLKASSRPKFFVD